MATLEFVLKSMCIMPYTRITVRETSGKSFDVLGSGMYDKILRRYGDRQVISSHVSDDTLFIDVSATLKSCEAFVCQHAALCVVNACLGDKCPLTYGHGICRVCTSRSACHK